MLVIMAVCTASLSRSQESNAQITVSVPSTEEEATSIWRTINDIQFFDRMGYTVNLPEDERIDALVVKSKEGKFGNRDYEAIYALLESDVFHERDYLAAFEKVKNREPAIRRMILRLDTLGRSCDWDFKMFDHYNVVLTLYGSGGSYDSNTGKITLFATPDGGFKMYADPANTIIHEIVHMGIEASIVQKYNVPHALKERVVDDMVLILFGDTLPEYRVQNSGDPGIDRYLRSKDDLKNLDMMIKDYIAKQ